MLAPFSASLTGTALEREYRALATSIARVPPVDSSFDPSAYDRRSVARARAHWSARMVDEYTSTSVFGALAAQLMEANAPLDTTAVALRMGQDELIHAEACSGVVAALGGDVTPMREASLTQIARHPGLAPRERALRNVLFATCISEMHSVAYFVTSLERMTDPFLRGVTRRLLSDEVLHGSFGFHYLETCRSWLDADASASVARYLRFGSPSPSASSLEARTRRCRSGETTRRSACSPLASSARSFVAQWRRRSCQGSNASASRPKRRGGSAQRDAPAPSQTGEASRHPRSSRLAMVPSAPP